LWGAGSFELLLETILPIVRNSGMPDQTEQIPPIDRKTLKVWIYYAEAKAVLEVFSKHPWIMSLALIGVVFVILGAIWKYRDLASEIEKLGKRQTDLEIKQASYVGEPNVRRTLSRSVKEKARGLFANIPARIVAISAGDPSTETAGLAYEYRDFFRSIGWTNAEIDHQMSIPCEGVAIEGYAGMPRDLQRALDVLRGQFPLAPDARCNYESQTNYSGSFFWIHIGPKERPVL
jgi:hypothetical protein